ncbi:hypothetical protein [Streptomyces scopuliridis]|uniref:hypothetical protein n=1 Tax=Streptomyces scopuliridis TaxID=452529 RepID=UPI0035E07602
MSRQVGTWSLANLLMLTSCSCPLAADQIVQRSGADAEGGHVREEDAGRVVHAEEDEVADDGSDEPGRDDESRVGAEERPEAFLILTFALPVASVISGAAVLALGAVANGIRRGPAACR